MDEESGLYYYGMRYYSAWTCRFISVDPLADKYPFYTPYQYCGNNPMTFNDLDGAETKSNQGTNTPINGQQDIKFEHVPLIREGAVSDIKMASGTYSYYGNERFRSNATTASTSTSASAEKYTVTVEQMKQIFPHASDKVLKEVVPILNKYMSDFGINNDYRFALFVSQVGHETGGFQKSSVTESTYYKSEERLLKIYGKYFNEKSGRDPSDYLYNSEKVANVAYARRMGNGDESTGDGYKFRGRGLIQLTGRDNYTDFTAFYNKTYNAKEDFIKNPDKIADNVELSVLSALWYFKVKVVNAEYYYKNKQKIPFNIDKYDLEGVTRLVNGGTNGYDPERINIYNDAKKVLKF